MAPPATASKKESPYMRRAKAALKRGDKYMWYAEKVTVRYSKHFETFCQRVAREFRAYIVYNSDKGKFARGLVKASGELKKIHDGFQPFDYSEGHRVELSAAFARRKDIRPGNRWVMIIRFAPTTWQTMEADAVVPSKKTTEKLHRDGFNEFLDRAQLLAADIGGEQGKRIRRFLDLADKLSFNQAMNLWYYDDVEVFNFTNMGTKKAKRALEFKRFEAWRRYPFRGWRKYKTTPNEIKNSDIIRSLIESDKQAYNSIYWINRRAGIDSLTVNHYVKALMDHMRKLQRNPQHLYSVYR